MPELNTDAEILAGAVVTVSLGGEVFEYSEPTRRQARAMLCELIPLQEKAQSADPVERLKLVDAMLDWLARWCEPLRKNKTVMDGALENEIGAAFNAVAEMVTRPFVRLAMEMQNGASHAPQENMTNPPPTS